MKKGRIVTALCLLLAAAAGLLAPWVLKSREDRILGKLSKAEGVESVSLNYARETGLTEKLAMVRGSDAELNRLPLEEGVYLSPESAVTIVDDFLKALTGKSSITYYRTGISSELRYYLEYGSLVLWCVEVDTDVAVGEIWLDDTTGCILEFVLNSGEDGQTLPQLLIEKAGENSREAIENGVADPLTAQWKERLPLQSITVTKSGQLDGKERKEHEYSEDGYFGSFYLQISGDGGASYNSFPVVMTRTGNLLFNKEK